MMHRFLPLLGIWLLAANSILADVTIKLPATAQGDVGDFIQVAADTTGAVVRWYAVDASLKLFPVNLLKDTHTAVVIGKSPGSFRLLAWTADKDGPSEAAVCVITIGSPPSPGPGPPPQPGPGPLPPNDSLAQAVAAAWAQETDPTRTTQVQLLAALYRQASTDTVNDASLAGTSDVLAVLQKKRKILLPDTALLKVRTAIEGELNKILSQPVALDAAKRKRLADLFSYLADILGGLR